MKKKKKILIIAIAVIIIAILGFIVFAKDKESPYNFATVSKKDITEEVLVTGIVRPARDVDLRFETGGTIEKVYVTEGSQVKRGGYLIKLYTGKLYSQFLQAQASYNQAKAELDQFIAGATFEEIQVAEQVVENAKTSLADSRAKAINGLNEKYDDALVYLSNASSTANLTLADLNNLEPSYFSSSTAISSNFREKEGMARNSFFGTASFEGAREIVNLAITTSSQNDIDQALIKMRESTNKIKEALDYTREAISGPTLRDKVTASDQTTIDSDISNINIILTNISTAQQAISSQKIANQINVNSAQSTLEKAKDDLVKLKANPRSVDIAIYQARLSKSFALMTELRQKLNDAILKAPFAGTVSKVNVKIGETVISGSEAAVSLITNGDFQIEVDVPEVDIGKVQLANPVDISLDAFPSETWKGEVVEIEPAETIVDGVIYYKITIVFKEIDDRVRSGMSADISIKTNKRSNALVIPYRAINYRDNQEVVKVLKKGKIKEVKVETGLKGSDGNVEILTGLNEGEEIITFIKK